MALSNAVDVNAISRTLGYALDFRDTQTAAAGVLPVRIAVLSSIGNVTATKTKITDATPKKVLEEFGNCPAVQMADILNKNTRVAIDVIAVDMQGTPTTANAALQITGEATSRGKIAVVVNGVDFYEANFIPEASADDVANAILEVLPKSEADAKPIVASKDGAGKIKFISAFAGVLANDISIQFEITPNSGISAGADSATATNRGKFELHDANGAPVLTNDYLAQNFGDVWYSIVVNPYGARESVYNALKEFNGIPSENSGTGRWNAQVVKPFIAFSGTTIASTQALLEVAGDGDDLTNALVPCPNSANTPAQIAAAVAALFAQNAAAKPHLDVAGRRIPVITLYGEQIGESASYVYRDNLAKGGISTVTFDDALNGYVVQDLITFRRMPDQSNKARDWNYCRNLMLDFNIAFNYQVLQARTLMGRVIVKDDEIISAGRQNDIIRLSVWKAAVLNFFTQMIAFAYMTDQEYSNESLHVELSGTNPKRINTLFAYKRTETVGIASTTAYAGFSFGEE